MADSVKIRITGDDSPFNSTLGGIEKRAKGAMSGVGAVFKGMMASQIVTRGVSALANGLRGAIDTGMQFGETMSKVAATSGATGDELDRLSEKAKQMGATTQFTASEAAEAMNYMAMAGWKTEEMLGGIDGIMNLAAASGEDLATTSDIVTDALTAFGMTAEDSGHFADILAAASSNANTNVAMMGDTFKYVAPLAGALGYDAEDVAVAVGLMANSGIKASQAGTSLRGLMTRLSKPTKESSEAMKALGLSITNADGTMKPFMQVMEEMRDSFSGLTQDQKANYAAMLAGQEGMSGLLAIVNASEGDFEKLSGAITNCNGAAEEMANVRMDNLAGDVKIMQSALEGLQLTANESMEGTARTLVQEATGIIDQLNQAGKAGGIGGIFDAAVAQIPKLLPKVTKGLEGLIKGIGKRLPGLVKGLVASVPDLISSAGDLVPNLVESLSDMASAAVDGLITNLPQIAWNLTEALVKVAQSAITGAGKLLGNSLKALFGIQDRTYESWGPISGELTYDVDVDADFDYSAAQTEATQAWTDFVAELKGYGLTTEQIAQLLAFTGTQEELDAYIEQHFPDLDAAAKAAIKAKFTPMSEGGSITDLFGESEKYGLTAEDIAGILVDTDCTEASIQQYLSDNFPNLDEAARAAITTALTGGTEGGRLGSRLTSELKGLGIKPEDIVTLITAQAEGDTTTVEGLLETKYAGVKQQAIDALTNAWNSSEASFATNEAGLSFGAQLLVDMFTDGIADDDESVDAALQVAKDAIDQKRRELIAYINGGGENQEGAQDALDKIEAFDTALTDYATNYAGATKAECQAAAADLLALASQVDDTTARILGNREKLTSAQENLYTLGTGGVKLTQEDTMLAMGWVKNQLDADKAAAEAALAEARENAKTAEEYAAAQAAYDQAMAAAQEKSRASMGKLLSGQMGDNPAVQVAAALADVHDQIQQALDSNGALNQSEVEQMLRDAGYGEDVITGAIEAVFGSQTYHTAKGVNWDTFEGIEGLTDDVISQLQFAFESNQFDPDVVASTLENAGYGGEFISNVLSQLFTPDDMYTESFDFDSLAQQLDFGDLGSAVQTALDAGLLQSDVSVGETILSMIGDSMKTSGVEVGEDLGTGMEEGMADTSGVKQAGVALGEAGPEGAKEGAQEASPSKATQEVGENIVEGLVMGMSDTGSVNAAGRMLGEAAVNAVKGSATGTYAAGFQVAAGVARGIAGGRSLVVNAALSLAQATVQAIREALQIHSPSRVAVGLGDNFGIGFGVGLDESLRNAVQSAQNVVGLANLAPKADFSGITGAFGSAVQELADIEGNRPLDVYLNGKHVGRAMAGDNARAAAGLNRRIGLGYGK